MNMQTLPEQISCKFRLLLVDSSVWSRKSWSNKFELAAFACEVAKTKVRPDMFFRSIVLFLYVNIGSDIYKKYKIDYNIKIDREI